MKIEPCPFCGCQNICTREGSTFRWMYAGCEDCGAQAGEIRVQTIGTGSQEEWREQARADAFAEWNRRTPPPPKD